MKKFSKKFVVLLTLTSFLASVSVPALAQNDINSDYFENNQEVLYGDYCDYTLSELDAMIPVLPNGISDISSEYDFVDKGKEKAEYLSQFDDNLQYINQLSLLDIDNLYDIIINENLTQEQAENLVKTWAENEAYGVDAVPPTDIETPTGETEENISTYAYSGDIAVVGNNNDNTGYHYIVRSMPGYNKASGYFSLPTTTAGSDMPADNPDVPYGFFGLYTEDDTIGLDLGTVLFIQEGYWRFCVSGYVQYTTDQEVADEENDGDKYTRYYKELEVNDETYKFTKAQCPKVYFVANATKKTGYDNFRLTIINGSTWATIGEININTNENGYTGLAPNRSYLNSDYSNCRVHREVTLAYNSDPDRELTGTKLIDAKWDTVYIYSPTVTALWGTSHTRNAQYVAKTADRARKVSTTIISKWNEDITQIICE